MWSYEVEDFSALAQHPSLYGDQILDLYLAHSLGNNFLKNHFSPLLSYVTVIFFFNAYVKLWVTDNFSAGPPHRTGV
jgi:hypothetical protein